MLGRLNLLLIAFSSLTLNLNAQVNEGSQGSIYTNLFKLGHLAFDDNYSFNTIGIPISFGFASSIKNDWIFDLQFQYASRKNFPSNSDIDNHNWLELVVGFQKRYFFTKNEVLSINPRFGFGLLGYKEQSFTSATNSSLSTYQKTGIFFHFGPVINCKLSKRFSLFTQSNIRLGGWDYGKEPNTNSPSRQPSFKLEKLNMEFSSVPIELGLALNFPNKSD